MNVFEVICTGTLEAWHPIPLSSQKLSGTPGMELDHLKMKHETFRHLSSHRHLSTGRPVCLDMKQGAINQLFLRLFLMFWTSLNHGKWANFHSGILGPQE